MNLKEILKGNYFYSMFWDIIEEDSLNDMQKLIFAWQQQTHDFLKYTPKEVMDYFISNFEDSNGATFYRSIRLKYGSKEKEWKPLVASTTDINVANTIFDKISDGQKRWVYLVTGEKILYIDKFRDLGEHEVIIYKPKKIELLNSYNKNYKEIDNKTSHEIIETYKPLGKFWTKQNGKYVAIDNSTGEAWVEDFKTFEECIKYLEEYE